MIDEGDEIGRLVKGISDLIDRRLQSLADRIDGLEKHLISSVGSPIVLDIIKRNPEFASHLREGDPSLLEAIAEPSVRPPPSNEVGSSF